MVIHIRYQDLSAGMHGRAEGAGRGTTVYLRPGLTSAQRSAVLRRLRQEARRGFGPSLPFVQLAVAITADRVRSVAGQVLAAFRLHPAVIGAPALIIAVMAGLFLLTAVPARAPRVPAPSAVSPALVATLVGGTAPVGPGRAPAKLREYFRLPVLS
jgi:hypothetical protein